MSNEVRTQAEGLLRWVAGSGSGNSWGTGATPASGRVGLVRSWQYTSGQTVQTVMERGIPNHNKVVSKQPIQLTFSLAWTGSGIPFASAGGASVPYVHLEHFAARPEEGLTPTGYWTQFYGVALSQFQFTEGDEDTINLTCVALGMSGANNSGFLTI